MIPPLVALGASILPTVWDWVTGDKAPDTVTAVAAVVAAVAGTDDPQQAALVLTDPAKAQELRVRLAEITAAAAKAEREAELEIFKAEIADTANAREASLKLVEAGSKMGWAPAVISTIITAGFFAMCALLLYTPPGMDERAATLLNVLLGTMAASFGTVVSYWLGSSAGSKRNGESIRAVAEAQARK